MHVCKELTVFNARLQKLHSISVEGEIEVLV